MDDHSETKALLKVWSIVFISLSYSYLIASKIPKGKLRLLSFTPIFTLYTILPLYLTRVLTTGVTASFITWLTNSKLLLLAFDLGPLVRYPQSEPVQSQAGQESNICSLKSFLMFSFIAAFPIKIKDSTSDNTNSSKVLPLNLWSKILISSILIPIGDNYIEKLHQGVLLILYSCLLCFLVDIAMGLSNLLVKPIMKSELSEPSNEPYMATSLQDFWGRRWNLMVTYTLRHTVYNPTRVFLSKYLNVNWAQAVSTIMTFLVSGLMHELIFFYVTRVIPSWEVTWFFLFQGICVTIEVALKRQLDGKLKLGWALTGPLTVGFVMWTGYLWFFPPLVRNKIDIRTFEEVKLLYGFLIGLFSSVGNDRNS